MAEVILGKVQPRDDSARLTRKIEELLKKPRKEDPAWWNDLAGAHLRLGKAEEAVKLLEPVLEQFKDNYGIHANLGTAYHLLGRYQEAEREIARDLEINPDAHFGLEKYHLALLHYLCRDEKYQFRHVYVDEFTFVFLLSAEMLVGSPDNGLATNQNSLSEHESTELEKDFEDILKQLNKGSGKDNSRDLNELTYIAGHDQSPAYRPKWNLAEDPKLEEGVLYMASLNPKQPACFVMLGVLCLKKWDKNLAAAAFEKAIELGSAQTPLLKMKVAGIREHIRKAQQFRIEEHRDWMPAYIIFSLIPVVVVIYVLVIPVIGRLRGKKIVPPRK